MIDRPLEMITLEEIEQIVQEKWPEGKLIEYKRDTYGVRDEDKKELLKDVSSFANSQGGDILIGVDEDKEVPTEIVGVAIADADKEKLRLEGIIRQGLEPRIEFGIHHLHTRCGKSVFIIRVKESLLSPHRVVFQGKFGEFWSRSSAGKFSMDTNELRTAFTLTDSLYDQIRSFRQERVTHVVNGNAPVILSSGGRLILHLIPVSSFRSRQKYDVAAMPELGTDFPPMGYSGWNSRLNLDGYVSYGDDFEDGSCKAYTQFFRNGIVEAVLSDVVRDDGKGNKLLRAAYFESSLCKSFGFFSRILKSYKQLGLYPPIYCFLTLSGVKGASIRTESDFPDENRKIDRDLLLIPECVIDDLESDVTSILRPLFDLVWNASGHSRSFNFDSAGKWIGR